jgi:hypothetical protein
MQRATPRILALLCLMGCREPVSDQDAGTGSESDGGGVEGGHGECPSHRHYTCDDATEPVCAKYDCESDIVYGDQLDNIWTPNCVDGCHEPGGQWPDLDLRAPAFAALVNQPSTQTGLMNLVDGATSLPSQSYLWHKLRGTNTCPELVSGTGQRMPAPDACQLADTLIEAVEKWICCGACPSQEECQP